MRRLASVARRTMIVVPCAVALERGFIGFTAIHDNRPGDTVTAD